jgi:hypothetical protein
MLQYYRKQILFLSGNTLDKKIVVIPFPEEKQKGNLNIGRG